MIEEELFHRALEKPTFVEQLAYLDEACADSPTLRQHVERLLRAHRPNDSFLQPDFTIGKPAGECTGAVIGPYKLLEQIAEGGMGSVWMAQQTEPVKRLVAVKLIKAGMDSKQIIARFEAERQALALMDHPNIAKVLDAGATSSGRPYFVMELVKGIPITKYCDEHRLTPRQRLELFIPVCQAVQHAHLKGIIHRDLKPSNVLVALYDGKPVPKVIDFGVAKAAGQSLTDKTLVTGFGAIVGTLEYMSPEQAELNQLDIDTRSDVYALGVLLYELLTGTTPFTRKELEQAGLLEMLRLIREQEPPKPSTKLSTDAGLPALAANRGTAPAKLTRLLRGELDWIVMKALEKDRNRRYETANGFATDVQRYLADEPVQACPPSVGYRLRKFARRNKWVLSTVALLAVMLTVMGALAAENIRREWKAEEEAQERLVNKQLEDVRKKEELARQLATTEAAVNLHMARSDSLAKQAANLPTTTSKEAAAADAVLRQAEAELAQAEAALVTGMAEPGLRERVSEARRRLDQARGNAEQQLSQVLSEEKLRRDLDDANTARPTMAGDPIGTRMATDLFAKAFTDYGLELKPGQAATLAKRIRGAKPEVRDVMIVGLDNWAFVAAANHALSPAELRKIARAADDDPWRIAYREALAKNAPTTLKALARKARDLALPPASINLLALSLSYRGERTEAVDLLRWARHSNPKDIWIPYHLAVLLESGTRRPATIIEEQIGCYRLFLAVRPDSPMVWNNLGICLANQRKVDESIACFRAAVKLKPDYARAHGNLGNSLGEKGVLDEALAAHDEAIRLLPEHADYHSNRGLVLLHKGLVEEAIAALEKAIKLNPELAAAHSNLGNALHRKTRFKEARAACEVAIRLDPNLASAHSNLGVVLSELEKLDDAIAAFQNAIRLDPNDAHPYWSLAQAQCEKKQPAEGEKNARKALELNPNLPYAHNALGISLFLQDKLGDAMDSFRAALRHKPDHAAAHYNLAMVFLKQKKMDEALIAMELTIKHDPRHAEAHLGIGRILVDRKQYPEAVKFLTKAILLKAALSEAHYLLGLSHTALNDLEAAAKSLKEATRLDPNSSMSHFYLGVLNERQKRPEAAMACYKECIRLKPDNAEAHYNLGTLLSDKKQLDDAADAYRQAIKWNKDYAKAHHNLGSVLAMKGKVADAIPCYREALRCKPDYPSARAMLAQALNIEAWRLVAPKESSREDVEQAIKMASEAVELTPNNPGPWNTLGVGNYRTGKWDEAIPALKKSVSLTKEHDWYGSLFLAMTYWKKGDKAEARTWYDRGLKRIRDLRIDTDESRRFQAEAAALLGVAKEAK